jgi:membrane carboxypeptidase/penicillin-binding protein PbpC
MAVAPRQPGSSFKPYVYATAFMQGFTPATLVMDIPVKYPNPPEEDYEPLNYSETFHGPQLIRSALANSYNIPAVVVANEIGVQSIIDTAHAMGIETLGAASNYGLSLALGGGDITLLEHTYAFSVFANDGQMLGEAKPDAYITPGYRQLDPVSVLRVSTAAGDVLYQYEQPQVRNVLSEQVTYLIQSIMTDNDARTPAFGRNNPLTLPDRPLAAKTGTTNDWHDGWAMGYTPQYTVGIWTGNANHDAMAKGADGVRTAGPILQKVMMYLHQGLPVEQFDRPDGIVTATVDSTCGKLPTEYSPSTRTEVFIEGTVPTEKDDMHVPVSIDKTTGLVATPYCPPELVETRVFTVYPPEASEWVADEGIGQPPVEVCNAHGPGVENVDVVIASPRAFQSVGGTVTITGNTNAGSLERWWLQVGESAQPANWTPITGESGERITNGVLGTWGTQGLAGTWTIQLVLIDGGNTRTLSIPVHIDNEPPTVEIRESPRTFTRGKEGAFSPEVKALDNTAVVRVELFLNGQSMGASNAAPFTVSVPFEALPGEGSTRTYSAHVVAYDSVGNATASPAVELTAVLP